MSVFSEMSDLNKALSLALGTTLIGATTEAGREGFKEGLFTGFGTSLGAGLKTILNIPASIGKGTATGLGLTDLFKKGPDSESLSLSKSLGNLDLSGLKGLLGEYMKEEAPEPATPVWIWIFVAAVALLGVVVLFKFMKEVA